MSSISVLRHRFNGRRAAHAATNHYRVVPIGIGERVAAGAFEASIIIIFEAVVSQHRGLRPCVRGRECCRGGCRSAAQEVLEEQHACSLVHTKRRA